MLLESTVEALVLTDYGKRDVLSEDRDAEQARRLSGVYVDATFGRGGHSKALLSRLSADARLVVFDKDPQAIEVARELARIDRRVLVIHEAFSEMPEALAALGRPAGAAAPKPRVRAIALNTAGLDATAAETALAECQESAGLACDDPVRHGGARLLRALLHLPALSSL